MDEINGYASYLKTEKKVSENTLSSYLRDVRKFARRPDPPVRQRHRPGTSGRAGTLK